MRILKIITFVFILIVCNGCSWLYRFIIKNATLETIQVNYKLNSVHENGVFKNAVAIIERGNEAKPANFIFNEDSLLVSAQLPPKSRILIGGGSCVTYKGFKNVTKENRPEDWISFFNLDYLEIITPKGTIKAGGHMIEKLITKNKVVETRITIR